MGQSAASQGAAWDVRVAQLAQMPLWWGRNGTRKAASLPQTDGSVWTFCLPRLVSTMEIIVWAGWGRPTESPTTILARFHFPEDDVLRIMSGILDSYVTAFSGVSKPACPVGPTRQPLPNGGMRKEA